MEMIQEFKNNIKKCPNCSRYWVFDNDDVQEKTIYDRFYGDYKEHYIKCPKCNTYLELYNDKGIWK
jgi:predicted  nucleic acid-binding Zn-ribbon protein